MCIRDRADTVSEPLTVEPGKSTSAQVHVFAGAKEVDTLDAYKTNPGLKRFDLLIDWGWFYFITRPMFRAIDFLFKILGNFGLAVMAVTVLVKLAFLPIANRSYQSIAKMRSIQPKIKELKEKYGDDKHKFNMEQMELDVYKRQTQVYAFFAKVRRVYVEVLGFEHELNALSRRAIIFDQ